MNLLDTRPVTIDMPDFGKIDALAKEAFPPAEYLAPRKMVEMAKNDNFDFWALYDDARFVGYMAIKRHQMLTYLFFLAIDRSCRDRGCGSRAIETLTQLYPGTRQVVDLELLDETADNAEQRKHRREFYLRNGYQPTGHGLTYFGVDYEILCMDDAFSLPQFQEMLAEYAPAGFSPRYFPLSSGAPR